MTEKTLINQGKKGQAKRKIDVTKRSIELLEFNGLDKQDVNKSKTITVDKIFELYYNARKASGASDRTLHDYQTHRRYLKQFMQTEYNGLDNVVPTKEVIREWILHMMSVQKLKPSTINIRLRTVKSMFNWAVKEKIIKDSPFENVELLRVPDEDFEVLTLSQEKRLFGVCDLNTFVGLRDALLLSFLLHTGVRIGECINVTIADIDMEKKSVLIRAENAKTRKARTVYFGKRTQRLLAVFLQLHEQYAHVPYVFINEFGEQMDRDWAIKRISMLGKKANITGVRVSCHTMRHTFATRYIKATGDPFSLRRLLGHSTMEMVNRYVNQNTDDVHEQYQKFLSELE